MFQMSFVMHIHRISHSAMFKAQRSQWRPDDRYNSFRAHATEVTDYCEDVRAFHDEADGVCQQHRQSSLIICVLVFPLRAHAILLIIPSKGTHFPPRLTQYENTTPLMIPMPYSSETWGVTVLVKFCGAKSSCCFS